MNNVKVLNQVISDTYGIFNGDCVELMKGIPDNSIDYSVYSPPFRDLFTYSNSERDMGNCNSHSDFWTQYKFLIKEHMRTMKKGRNVSVHCMNLPTSKFRDGFTGLTDFRGEIIRAFQEEGFIYHSEVCIWKCPVVAVTRTKAVGLLHKTIKTDSSKSRNGLPDYVVTFKKPGENPEPITHTMEEYPVDEWQKVASPVWMDINQSDTLQYRSARSEEDEKHICPLQLEVIERLLKLYTNPNDIVLSPFAGIGSEGYVSLSKGRRFIGFELKESYYEQQVKNLKSVNHNTKIHIDTITKDNNTLSQFFS